MTVESRNTMSVPTDITARTSQRLGSRWAGVPGVLVSMGRGLR